MESVKYEGVYPCKHNNSTKKKVLDLSMGINSLLNLEMDERKGKQKRDKTNYLIKQQLK